MKCSILAGLCVFFLFALGGCYEDTMELTLKPDGSGSFKQKLVFSERVMVAALDDKAKDKIPLCDKEEIKKEIGSEFKLRSIKQTELADGGRRIEFEGTFTTPEEFFLSNYCLEHLKLRIVKADNSQAAIYYTPDVVNDPGPSLNQLYGLAKGLYVERTIHLPGKIQKTNGKISKDEKTVIWIWDLRDRKALTKTKQFLEGPDNGKGNVFFDASNLEFTLPLKASKQEVPSSKENEQSSPKGNLKAEVVSIIASKKFNIKDNKTEISKLEMAVELSWTDINPVAYKNYRLISITDDKGKDLVKDQWKSRRDIFKTRKSQQIDIKVEIPSEGAKELRNIEGQIDVITDVVKEKVVLEDIHSLAGKDSTGNEILDKVNFKIISVKGNSFEISIDGGHSMIKLVKMFSADGTELQSRGGMGSGDTHTYDYRDSLDNVSKCELEVITSEQITKVSFSLDRIAIP